MIYRQTVPILRWIGGKSRLAKKIIATLPAHTCYVEPFCGGAAIFLKKPPSKVEVINDINGDLVNLYRCIKYHHDEVIKEMQWALHSRELFNELNAPIRKGMTDIQRAGRFYALNKLAFGAKMHQSNFGYCRQHRQTLVQSNILRDIIRMNKRLNGVCIENTSWQDCIRRYDSKDTLFYCDPPYFKTVGYGVDFGLEHYQEMAALAKSIKGKMVISVNDIPEMHTIFSGLVIDRLEIIYGLSNAKNSKVSGELLIRSF